MCHGTAGAHGRKSQESQKGGPEGQHPPNGDGEDPLRPQQLLAVSPHEVPKPDLDSYVFLRVRERQENILVEPDTDEQRDYVIDLEKGSQHLIRYKTIAPLVASGAVQLI
uniref:cDNA FLJ50176, moderately similar to Homo sapiens SLD5 homolog (SLD5), mRNA n=1 Tax=Homo sapiens TaxID=9606 RepID=B4DRD5_HUMAN|nr:unnamed protein product [Homo sapiens]